MLFILGFTAITSVYEIAVTGKKTKSDKVKKFGEQINLRWISRGRMCGRILVV